jgi:N-acetylneuraminate synthase
MRANPVDKETMARDLSALRGAFTKSVVARADLPAGTVLRAEDLTTKKPGTGIPARRLPELVGRRLKRPVMADSLISDDDLG